MIRPMRSLLAAVIALGACGPAAAASHPSPVPLHPATAAVEGQEITVEWRGLI